MIVSHHSRFTCECNKEDINDDDDDDGMTAVEVTRSLAMLNGAACTSPVTHMIQWSTRGERQQVTNPSSEREREREVDLARNDCR